MVSGTRGGDSMEPTFQDRVTADGDPLFLFGFQYVGDNLTHTNLATGRRTEEM